MRGGAVWSDWAGWAIGAIVPLSVWFALTPNTAPYRGSEENCAKRMVDKSLQRAGTEV
ncbi:hypothetical protein [Bacillus sp. FJAT-42376]|uniref:hypothetical protein n=1 Tax=Bacillus sp. FJAT-42376 TaxID=2014076 RepID=UPI0013DDAC54|nr:hypothetical protein [Bacillus sp. FJAT-42376]